MDVQSRSLREAAGESKIAEHLAPGAEALVAGEDHRSALVGAADPLEEQIGDARPRVKKIHHNYYLPMTTATAVALFEERDAGPASKRAGTTSRTTRPRAGLSHPKPCTQDKLCEGPPTK